MNGKKTLMLAAVAVGVMVLAGCQARAERTDDAGVAEAQMKPVDFSVLEGLFGMDDENARGKALDSLMQMKEVEEYNFELFLLSGDGYAIRLPQYADSKHPFLRRAQDFFNACAVAHDVFYDYQSWAHAVSAWEMTDTRDMVDSIRLIDLHPIVDEGLRMRMQAYKDSVLTMMLASKAPWEKEKTPADAWMNVSQSIKQMAGYRFFTDEAAFEDSLTAVIDSVEQRGRELDSLCASKDVRQRLAFLNKCRSFGDQCALYIYWAPRSKDAELLTAVAWTLLDTRRYHPLLNQMWIMWRCICQTNYYGSSSNSSIPNDYYNMVRRRCYETCLKYIEEHPSDQMAMNAAAVLAGNRNVERYGREFGNSATEDLHLLRDSDEATEEDDEAPEVINEEEEDHHHMPPYL